jgi:hypothetical protein
MKFKGQQLFKGVKGVFSNIRLNEFQNIWQLKKLVKFFKKKPHHDDGAFFI